MLVFCVFFKVRIAATTLERLATKHAGDIAPNLHKEK